MVAEKWTCFRTSIDFPKKEIPLQKTKRNETKTNKNKNKEKGMMLGVVGVVGVLLLVLVSTVSSSAQVEQVRLIAGYSVGKCG